MLETTPPTPVEASPAVGNQEGGLGVRSPVPHSLHPTAQKILTAAKKILIERGFQGMTLQAISAEAKVNKAGVWYYFGGKQQLVLALLDDIAVRESLHFGTVPPPDATLDQRVELLVGSATEVKERVRRYAAFYELLPEAARDDELRRHLLAYYRSWYEWAAEVLAPPLGGSHERGERSAEALGQFTSILLDGIFMQMLAATPAFDLEAAVENARRALCLLARGEA